MPEQAKLEAMARQFAPTEIGADVSALPANERQALAKLVQAGWVMDALFLRQVVGRQRGTAAAACSTDTTPARRRRGCTTS